jgi:hypothetical protein
MTELRLTFRCGSVHGSLQRLERESEILGTFKSDFKMRLKSL